MSSYLNIGYLAERGIARIVLNRPQRRNALDQELIAELRDALRVAAPDNVGLDRGESKWVLLDGRCPFAA